MQKLIAQLSRLYLPANAFSQETLALHVLGQTTLDVNLTTDDGWTRAMLIPFHKVDGGEDGQHWHQLCALAQALQTELGLPAPAVSTSSVNGYGLWLSLKAPVPKAQAQRFLELLRRAYLPDQGQNQDPELDAVGGPVELPPCLNLSSGKWAAFIHPGMGASFADESGLEMAPPFAGQAAFLEGLHGIGEVQFAQALAMLEQSQGAPASGLAANPAAGMAPGMPAAADADTLLLRDATLEDIVKFLHARHIEPTFRHLMR
jgi:hypothetical protein